MPYSPGQEPRDRRARVLWWLRKNLEGHASGLIADVNRRPVNWSSHRFDEKGRFSVGIVVDESRLFPSSRVGGDMMTVSFEAFSKVFHGQVGVDDELNSSVRALFVDLLDRLSSAVSSDNMQIINRIVRESDVVIESSDATLNVQGIVITLEIEY